MAHTSAQTFSSVWNFLGGSHFRRGHGTSTTKEMLAVLSKKQRQCTWIRAPNSGRLTHVNSSIEEKDQDFISLMLRIVEAS